MGSREPHKKYPRKKTSSQAPKSCLILSANPYLPTKWELINLFILCEKIL